MKRVLLTGATGFIGLNSIAPLVKRGYEVHAVSSKSAEEITSVAGVLSSNVQWHKTDLLRSDQVSSLIDEVRPTHLLHLSWYVRPGLFWTAAENLHWVKASLDLVEQFVSYGGERVVAAGTCAEYDWNYGYCSENVTPLASATLYGVSKHALHLMLEAFAARSGLSAAWGRIFFLYGPREPQDRLVASVIGSLLRGESARCSHGNQVRDFLHVQDVASAFVALLDSPVVGAVNIASGKPVSLKEIICKIAEQLNSSALVEWGSIPTTATDPPLLVADVRRLKDEVSWRASYDLDEGIEQTILWWKAHLATVC